MDSIVESVVEESEEVVVVVEEEAVEGNVHPVDSTAPLPSRSNLTPEFCHEERANPSLFISMISGSLGGIASDTAPAKD